MFSGERIVLTAPWKRNINIATVHCGVSVQLASGNRCFPTGVVAAYQTKIRQVAGSIGSLHSIENVGNSCSLAGCMLRVDVGSVVGSMSECSIVGRCSVAAGGDVVVVVDCSLRIARACELCCLSNVRRRPAGIGDATVSRLEISGNIESGALVLEDNYRLSGPPCSSALLAFFTGVSATTA